VELRNVFQSKAFTQDSSSDCTSIQSGSALDMLMGGVN